MSELPPVVEAIQRLHIEGNVIPHSWYQHITTEAGLVDLVAITILADILYWYRPSEVRDEQTGKLIGYKKKFASDKLQRDYAAYEDLLHLTKRQAKDACLRLEKLGLITREFRSFQDKSGRLLGNVLFLEPVADAVERITYPDSNHLTEKRHTAEKRQMALKRQPSDGKTSYPMTEKRQTNTETTNGDYTETSNKNISAKAEPPKTDKVNKTNHRIIEISPEADKAFSYAVEWSGIDRAPKEVTKQWCETRIRTHGLKTVLVAITKAPGKPAAYLSAIMQGLTLAELNKYDDRGFLKQVVPAPNNGFKSTGTYGRNSDFERLHPEYPDASKFDIDERLWLH